MPSRKVISIFIISLALVVAIVVSTGAGEEATKALSQTLGGSLSAGPEVKLAENSDWQTEVGLFSGSLVAEASTTETLTDEFSRSFMANYLALKQSDQLDSTSADNLINKSAEFLEKTEMRVYTIKDIVVSSDTSKAAITKYGNELGLVLRNNTPKQKSGNEMILFKTMMEQKDQSKSLELKNIATIYKNTATSFSKVTVPSTFIESHLKFVNSINGFGEATLGMSAGLSDPIKSLQAMVYYTQSLESFSLSKMEIQTKILKSGANYKQGENGYYFFFGI